MQRGCGLTVGTRSGGAEGGRVLPRAKDVTTLLVRGTLHMACVRAPLTEWPPSECRRGQTALAASRPRVPGLTLSQFGKQSRVNLGFRQEVLN